MNHQLFNNNHLHRQTQLDSRFVVPSFLLSDDPIANLNKAMMFLNHVDAFDSDCDEAPTISAIFMARLSPAGSINGYAIVQETGYSKHLVHNNDSYVKLTTDNNVISYVEYMTTIENDAAKSVPPHEQDNAMILYVIEQMQSQVK
ncbi:hypothetical protein Tco_1248681 [Tanacetum coccineum]